ncbi:MAG: chromate transporter [Nitrospirae bacterium]|nr:chromate transporter [Nitrospirota bacterium]
MSISSDSHSNLMSALKVITVCLAIWLTPTIMIGIWTGWNSIFIDIAVLFSKAAVLSFGGAYAVLSYISQQAVMHYHWIGAEQMIDGLGLAETTPGPLIMVTEFVGYIAAYTRAKGVNPALAGAFGGLLTVWVTFLPSFLCVLAGAPYIEKLRKNVRLGAILSAITASVVGVILNLSVLFTYHTLFHAGRGFDWFAILSGFIYFVGIVKFKWPMIPVIIISTISGYLWKILL